MSLFGVGHSNAKTACLHFLSASKDGGMPLSVFFTGMAKELSGFFSFNFFVLSTKQGSCKYHFVKSIL